MSIRCFYCGREYDVTLFEFNCTISCICGRTVTFKHEEKMQNRSSDTDLEESKVREIGRLADRIASMIVTGDYPMIDIEIEKEKLKERISELFPEKVDLYELIYEPRFRRLKEQFPV